MSEGTAYRDLLRAVMEREGVSRRKLSSLLAEKTGNLETSEYRALGKYLEEEKPETPERERAAILAVLLREPKLALVSGATERRGSRRAELETRVAQNTRGIDALREAVGLLLGQVVALGGEAPELPADALPPTAQDTDP